MRKKSWKTKKPFAWLCILLCIAATAVAGTFRRQSSFEDIIGFSPTPTKKIVQPDELLQQYFIGISLGQYEDLYEMLTEQSQAAISKDDFVTKNKNIYAGIEAKNFIIGIKQIYDHSNEDKNEPETAQKFVEYSVSMDTVAGEVTYDNHAIFELSEEKEYLMHWTAHTIFPSLNDDDRVRVNTMTAKRGNIYDRNGEMLAGPGAASSVGFVPGKMRREENLVLTDNIGSTSQNDVTHMENSDEAGTSGIDISESAQTFIYNEEDISKVAELLEMTPESIIRRLSASYVRDDTFVLLRNISKDAQELIEALLTVNGIMISTTTVRQYPLGEKASHLVGYIQGINAEELEVLRDQGYHMNSALGKAGLERIYEEQLRARDGREVIILDSQGDVKETLARKERIDGKDIQLTIDAYMQSQLYDLFALDKSCSVAMNPKTGEVLALVSTPTYDANDFVLGMTMSKWASLNEDKDKPMINRFRASLCPGSTMKAITAAIGINTGIIQPNEDFGRSGLRWRKDGSWGGYYITTTIEYNGPANIANAMAYSDNIYFAKTAMRIGAEKFAEELVKIGFEERIPFEYGLYSSIISSTETFTSEIQLADSGYGQGQILINPIHLAAIYAAFVNDGNILQPRLINSRNSTPIFWKENAFSPETAKIVLNSLIEVIERGTGREARVPGITLAGKTGTGEIKHSKEDQTGTELGWFAILTADENSENPLLVISMVEDVKNRGGSGYVVSKVKTLFR